ERVIGAGQQQPLERELGVPPLDLRVQHALLGARDLRLGLYQLELRHAAELHACAVLLDQAPGLREITPLNLELLDRGPQAPVGLPHVVRDVLDLGLDLEVDDLALDLLRLERRPLVRSEEHTSELQSRENLVCRLLLGKKN